MKKVSCVITILLLCAVIAVFMMHCAEEVSPSLFDPDATGRPQPVITGIVPQDSALAVVTNLTITGSNFSSALEENFIYFNSTPGEILTASATQLVVKPPYLVSDSVKIKIAVHGAELFSEIALYKLKDPAPELTTFAAEQVPWYIGADADGNIFTSIVTSGIGQGIKKITPGGVLSDYAPRGAELYWYSIKMGPAGILYCVRGVRAIFQIPAGGGAAATWVAITPTTVKLADLDFDKDLNCWAVGNNTEIYRVKPDKTVNGFPFDADVKSVRIYDDYVYLAANKDTAFHIYRFQILPGDQLGAEEVYFDFSAAYPDYTPYAITFADDGDLYIGTDGPETVVVVHPGGSHEPLYPGLFADTKTFSLHWDHGTNLYIVREGTTDIIQTILKVGMNKNGAPYYGRGDS